MKTIKFLMPVIVTLLLLNTASGLCAQTGEPWTSKDLIEPETLAMMISDQKAQKPVIFNIGPLANIKGAITIGATVNKANLEKLKKELAKVPKDKMVVIYCGCCPFRNCPNIRPAFNLMKEQGYKNPKLLNLKQNLKSNWTDFGYPMD
jgi:thiosulfate/3-mercaptopyruvate sulfurtransferase